MKRSVLLIFLMLAVASCNQQPTLQTYFVEKSQNKDFVSADLSPSVLNLDAESLSPDQQKAIETFKKMNVLAFVVNDSNASKYASESAKVKKLLKDPKYQELMHFGSGKDGGSISYVGADDDIDEFVLFANREENGFAVVRVLGDDMSPNSIMQMVSVLKNSKLDLEQLKPLQQIMTGSK